MSLKRLGSWVLIISRKGGEKLSLEQIRVLLDATEDLRFAEHARGGLLLGGGDAESARIPEAGPGSEGSTAGLYREDDGSQPGAINEANR